MTSRAVVFSLWCALAVGAAGPSSAQEAAPKPRPRPPGEAPAAVAPPVQVPPPAPGGQPPSAEQPAPAMPVALPPKMTEMLRLQVMLDRAGFSPGEIDGRGGPNTQRALEAWQRAGGGPSAQATDQAPPQGAPVPPGPAPAAAGTTGARRPEPTTEAPAPSQAAARPPAAGSTDRAKQPGATDAAVQPTGDVQPLATYSITEADVAGPFIPALPDDLVEQSKLKALAYASVVELLGERFHVSPALLKRLNPKASFVAGEEIVVPNVEPMMELPKHGRRDPGKGQQGSELVITVVETTRSLDVTDASGRILMHAPVTVGSEHDPLPVGEWKVTDTYDLPIFHYNPDLFWDADPSHAKAVIQPGPNNPVGTVWIDITKEHYGFHGTPEPGRVGHTASHGCIRLTNWDAVRLAGLVRPGTRVVFRK